MLKEFHRLRQDEGSFRRLFCDDRFDLYLWYERAGAERPLGFQLVYPSGNGQKALTWTERSGYSHMQIDEGEERRLNQSPILVQDGNFEQASVAAELEGRMRELDPAIRDFVLNRLAGYPVAP